MHDLTILYDTAATKTTTPSTKILHDISEAMNTYVTGVTNQPKKIPLKGTYFLSTGDKTGIPAYWVPGSKYLIVSISQIALELDAKAFFDKKNAYVWSNDKVLGHAKVQNGLYVQADSCEKVSISTITQALLSSLPQSTQTLISTNVQTVETLKLIHDSTNHTAYSTLRKIYNYPPADKDHPDPVCNSCLCAEMKHDKLATDALSGTSRAWQTLTADISRKQPPDHRGNQREIIIGCTHTDHWESLFMKRKSDAPQKVEEMIMRLNSQQAPLRVAYFKTDNDSVLVSEEFEAMLAKHGVKLKLSAPDEQRANPAENIMKRHGRQKRAIMFRANAPKGSWSYASSHVCSVHNALKRPNRVSPHEEATGIRSTFQPHFVWGSRCWARLYSAGKEERRAVECIYLGFDSHCNAAIVRPINGKLASTKERYSKVTKHEPSVFPYTLPEVPRPHEYAPIDYESDSDDEEIPHKPDPSHIQQHSSRSFVPNPTSFANDELGVDLDAANQMRQHSSLGPAADGGLPNVVRRSTRETTLSSQALENIATLTSVMHEPNMIYSYLHEQHEASPDMPDSNNNPFAKLFDPKSQVMWDDPKSYKACLAHKMKEHFLAAMMTEKAAWDRHNVIEIMKRQDIPIDPTTGKPFPVMRCHPVWKTKQNADKTIDKFKYRLTVNGKFQDKALELCYESMVSMPSIKLFFEMSVRFGLYIRTTDAKEFYLNMPVREGEQYYMEIPEGWTEYDRNTFIAKLNRAVYGVPSAAQTAGQALTKQLVETQGFQPCPHDNKNFIKWYDDESMVMCAIHADDALWQGTSEELVDQEIAELSKFIPLTINKDPNIFRGIEIRRNKDGSITLHQQNYLLQLLNRFDLNEQKFPATPGTDPAKAAERDIESQATSKQIHEYMIKQGCLQWSVITSLSCAYQVNWLARHMRNPQPHHIAQQKRCLLYMISIADKGITFRKEGHPDKLIKGYLYDSLLGWADATWVDRTCPESKSTSGYCYETDIGPIITYVGKQNNITNSSCESEIMSNRSCCMQGIWLRGLIKDMGFNFSKPTEIMQDNTGAIALCKTDAHHARSRHFRVACHYLHELYDRRIFRFTWIQTDKMIADILTKPLHEAAHNRFEKRLTNCV
jgi:hypothetical protein